MIQRKSINISARVSNGFTFSINIFPVLPMFVNTDIRKEMYKGADANVDAQFKKLYIYHMENVSILFADIKVSMIITMTNENR